MVAYDPNSETNQLGVPTKTLKKEAVHVRKYIKLKKSDDNRNCQCFLDERKKKFCDEYLKTGDLSYSARAAGYNVKNTNRLLETPIIKQYLAMQAKKEIKITKDWYVCKLEKVIDGGIPDEPIPEEDRLYSTRDALTAGDQVSRLKGFYEPDKQVNLNTNLQDYKELMIKIKDKERGY